jgi:acylpyruvate hydrolase
MKFASFTEHGKNGTAAEVDGVWRGQTETASSYCGSLQSLIAGGHDALRRAYSTLSSAPGINIDKVKLQPPVPSPEKIVCIGLNYVDHSAESGFKQPDFPTVFSRFNSSLHLGHGVFRCQACLNPVVFHDAENGRCDRDWHTLRRGAGAQAATLDEAR